MNLSTLFDALRGKRAAKAASAEEKFRDLVADLVDGTKPVKIEAAHSICESAGRSPDDLAAAVEALTSRRERQARVRAVPQLMAERAENEAKVQAAAKVWEAAQQTFNATAPPLWARGRELQKAEQAGRNLQADLVAECTAPELLARHAALVAKLHEMKERRGKVGDLLSKLLLPVAPQTSKTPHPFAVPFPAEVAKHGAEAAEPEESAEERAARLEFRRETESLAAEENKLPGLIEAAERELVALELEMALA